MADFFFFTDPANLSTQTTAQAYGPDSTVPNEKYRVTSMHSGTNAYAYAVTEGDIIIVDNIVDASGTPQPNLVNIILKPNEQAKTDVGNVKYFIYRGIQKSSLIDTTTSPVTIKPYSASTVSNNFDLLKRINANYQKLLSQPGNTLPAIPELSAFLVDATSGGGTPVYKTFFKQSGSQFQRVKAGDSIGIFDNTLHGFEIILDTIGFEPTVDDASLLENIINVPLPSSSSQADVFQNNNLREAILNYVDPCAYYGSLYYSKVKYNTTDSSGNATSTKCDGDEVYQYILKGAGSATVFYNRNMVYLDIRNELDYSIDYFGNYAASGNRDVYASANIDAPAATGYYTNMWPLMTFGLSDFVAGNPSNTDAKNSLYINLPKGNNYTPFIYISAGEVPDTSRFFERKNKHKKFIDLFYVDVPSAPPTLYTSAKAGTQTSLQLLCPNYTGNSTTEPICAYLKIKYLKTIPSYPLAVSAGTELKSAVTLDNIFRPLDMLLEQDAGSSSESKTRIYQAEHYINNVRIAHNAYVSSIGITEDSDQNKILFTCSVNQYNDQRKNNFFSLTSKIGSSDNSVGLKDFLDNIDGIQYTDVELTNEPLDSFGNYPVLKIIAPETQDVVKNFLYQSAADLQQLFLKKQEYDWIILTAAGAGFLSDFNVHLGYKETDSGTQPYSNPLTQEEFDLPYVKFELVLRGYYINGSGDVELKEVSVPEYDVSMAPIAGTKLFTYVLYTANILLQKRVADDEPAVKEYTSGDPTGAEAADEPSFKPKYKKSERGYILDIQNNTPVAGTTTYLIKSKVYLKSVGKISDASFNMYCKHFAQNIQLVWSSATNLGLPAFLGRSIDVSDPENPVYTGGNNIVIKTVCGILNDTKTAVLDTAGNPILDATIIIDTNPNMSKIKALEDGECYFDVVAEANGLSYVIHDGSEARYGRMVFDNKKSAAFTTPDPYFSFTENIPGHEWGHVLGLCDRYAGVVGLRNGNQYLKEELTAGGSPVTTVTLPIHDEYDPEYIISYRWRHNLMATQTSVYPVGYVGPIEPNPGTPPPTNTFVNKMFRFFESPNPSPPGGYSYVTRYAGMRPTESPAGKTPPAFSTVYIFISEQQFQQVIDYRASANGHDEYYHKTTSTGDIRENFPKKNTFILNGYTDNRLKNFTGNRLDWMGIYYAGPTSAGAFKTDYNKDKYPTTTVPWTADTLGASTSYLHPVNPATDMDYTSSLFERANPLIGGYGWIPEMEVLQVKIGDISTAGKRFNVYIGGMHEPFASKIDGQMVTTGEELINIHNLMMQLAQIDQANNTRGSLPSPLVDTIATLAIPANQINQIKNALAMFDDLHSGQTNSKNRILDKTVRFNKIDTSKQGFSNIGQNDTIPGERAGQDIWNVRGSYFEVGPNKKELPGWRLTQTLLNNGNLPNVIIKLRTGANANSNGSPANYGKDVSITYKIYTMATTYILGPNNNKKYVQEVSFELKYTELKNREIILKSFGLAGG